MPKLFRCHTVTCSGREFEADKPACPHCGLDALAQPQFASAIVPLVTIHFDPPSGVVRGKGKNVTLCSGKPVGGLHRFGEQASADPAAVNCKQCRAAEGFPRDGEWDALGAVPDWTVGQEIKTLT